MSRFLRAARGRLYRFFPSWTRSTHGRRLAGLERRWNLEVEGFTKEGFFRILQQRLLSGIRPGKFLELAAGDGLVGSLGGWLERTGQGWEVVAWEHRAVVARDFSRHRPGTPLHPQRFTSRAEMRGTRDTVGVTTRGSREASAICRTIRRGGMAPSLVGVWNPSRRPVWAKRLGLLGYRLELAWQNIEFYRRRRP